MAAGLYNFTIEQGARFAQTITRAGIATAIGYSARMDIRVDAAKTSTLILALTVANSRLALSSDGTSLIITVTISAVDTALLSFNTGYYDLEIIPPAGEASVERLLYGSVTLSKEVTG